MTKAPSVFGCNFLCGCILLLGLVSDHLAAQTSEMIVMRTSGEQAFENYRANFVDPENYADYGFRTYDEVARATLGTPLPITFITLPDLRAFLDGTKVRLVLKDAEKAWFPVIVDGEVRAKLELVRRDSTWTPGEFGTAKTAAAFGRATAGLTAKLETASVAQPRDISLVRIPALNCMFILIESQSGEFLVPVTAGSQFQLVDGTLYPAQDVMPKLRDYANAVVDPKKVRG
jgi:hypothetical protein